MTARRHGTRTVNEPAGLTAAEREALAVWADKRCPKLTARTGAPLARLIEPIQAATTGWSQVDAAEMRNLLLREVHRRQQPFWVWDEPAWVEVAGPSWRNAPASAPTRVQRSKVVALGHRLGGQRRLHARAGVWRLRGVADLLYGPGPVQAALDEVATTLAGWGTSPNVGDQVSQAVLDLLLTCASPRLADITEEALAALVAEYPAGSSRRKGIFKVSRVLAHLGIITAPLTTNHHRRGPWTETLESVPVPWRDWALRWRRLSTLEPLTVSSRFSTILVAGRWTAERHPEAVSPDRWTRDIAAEYVADTLTATIGQWAGSNRNRSRFGQPLSPRGKAQRIDGIRGFFCDLIEWEWLTARFDPRRVLSLPLSIHAQIGPNPRIIDDAAWAKLMAAGITLNTEDINGYGSPAARAAGSATTYYPIEMIRALVGVWLFGGCRIDEICRLEPDCVIWDQAHDADTGEAFTACLLRVPANKTSAAFSKPVDPIVGQLIDAWKLIRPTQPLLVDRKTGQRREFLFCHRGQRVGGGYLNNQLIPALCRKAGIPETDSRGALTSHRARATIATQLLNARDPLTLADLQQWLGHKHPASTRHYAAILQRTLTAAYRKADYFARNVRTIQVLIDRDAILTGAAAGGQPWKYYDLGDGYCSYDFFAKCPHRLACARCPFYLPKNSHRGQLLAVKEGIDQMLEQLDLTDDERAALEGDREAITAIVERLSDIPTPAGPTPNELGHAPALIPLTAVRSRPPEVP
jgi:integrase